LQFGLDVLFACACAGLLIAGWHMRGRRVLPGPPAAAAVATAAPAMAIFADGSRAEPLGRDMQLRVGVDSAERVAVRLAGGAHFQVVPNPRRVFEVQTRAVRVRVLGTVFSMVDLPSGQTQVLVERGRVEVAWLGGAELLHDGEGGVFPPSEPAATAAPAAPAAPTPPADDEAKPAEARARPKEPAAPRDDTADLIEAADVARLSGHPEDALAPLRDICDRRPGDRRAPVASFTMGRILLDDLSRPLEAAGAFHRARALWRQGPLADDALAREAEAWQRAGHPERARAAAREYLQQYPGGRHAAVMRQLAAR
jgi:transmembrane sensor